MNQYAMDLLYKLVDEQKRTNDLLAQLVAASKLSVVAPAPVDDDDEPVRIKPKAAKKVA